MGNICIFGDSIVWGAWDPIGGGWVSRLRSYIENKELDIETYNLGVSGDNINNLLQRFEVEAKAREPKLIIISIGTNDSQYLNKKGNYQVSPKDFETNLKKLINLSKKFTNNIILLTPSNVDETKTKPIPWNKQKYYDNENLKLFRDIIKQFCEKSNISVIDMLDLLNNNEFYDGLHPNSKGHQKIFEVVKKFLEEKDLLNKIKG